MKAYLIVALALGCISILLNTYVAINAPAKRAHHSLYVLIQIPFSAWAAFLLWGMP